jgi:hypothetical protein
MLNALYRSRSVKRVYIFMYKCSFLIYLSENSPIVPLINLFTYLWLRHYATTRKVAGSIPDEVNF